ncbi:MAG: arylsulfatase [Gemmataceae bacterium]|nr:arylsulfatase [Gemmataceae bacterium]
MKTGILSLFLFLGSLASAAEPARTPNIVFILADDLGYGDVGCYGQAKIQTPNIDKLAKDGMRFTHAYAGSTVCAPSRCALMTGLHTGHCRTRGNGGGGSPRSNVPLAPGDLCVAEMLKKAGYATALVGKWGLGEENSTGIPTKKGFDHFYGYLNQHHAHNYYPDYLIRNDTREPIPQNVQHESVENVAAKPTIYTPDLFLKDSLAFVEANKTKPFFLYFASTLPHANNEKTRHDKDGNEVPSEEPYANENWPMQEKKKAAMITRLDRDIGTLLKKLDELDLAKDTIVIFTSDNGPHREGGNDPAFFASSGPFRGIKRAMTDGGLRVPFIVRWPAAVKPGTTSEHVTAFWDFLPTVADLLGQSVPGKTDGLSILPTLTGKGEQKTHEFLYWEFHEGGTKQAVRHKNWKAIRLAPGAKLELYDVVADPGEAKNVAAEHPEVVAKIEAYLKTARTESKEFPITLPKAAPKKK